MRNIEIQLNPTFIETSTINWLCINSKLVGVRHMDTLFHFYSTQDHFIFVETRSTDRNFQFYIHIHFIFSYAKIPYWQLRAGHGKIQYCTYKRYKYRSGILKHSNAVIHWTRVLWTKFKKVKFGKKSIFPSETAVQNYEASRKKMGTELMTFLEINPFTK